MITYTGLASLVISYVMLQLQKILFKRYGNLFHLVGLQVAQLVIFTGGIYLLIDSLRRSSDDPGFAAWLFVGLCATVFVWAWIANVYTAFRVFFIYKSKNHYY